MKGFGEKLKELRTSKNISQTELINFMNKKNSDIKVSKSMISKWENGKEEPSKFNYVALIAEIFNVTTDYLIGISDKSDTLPLSDLAQVTLSEVASIPIVGTVRAGQPILAIENIEGYLPVFKAHLSNSKEYFCLRVKGDSMNLEFKEGTILLVEKTPCVENGEIAIVLIDGLEATVKKIVMNENMITLIPMSNNPEYIPRMYDMAKDKVQVIGKVRQAIKMY